MKNGKFKKFWDSALELADKKSPTILAGLALAGICATGYFAFEAGKKLVPVTKKREKDLADVQPDDKAAKKAVNKEYVKEMIPIVTPPIIMGVATGACILGGTKISNKRVAVLSAAYTMAEGTVKDLNAKMEETLGEKKVRSIKDAIVKDKMDKNPPVPEQIIVTGDGNVLCRDSYTGRPFYSNAQKIGNAINELSADCSTDMYVSLNDFYEKINLDPVPMGEDFGWNVDDLIRGQLPITISAQLTPDKQPCLCVEYEIAIREDYRRLR